MRQLHLPLILLLLFACNTKPTKTVTKDTGNIEAPLIDSTITIHNDSLTLNNFLPWEVDFYNRTKKANPEIDITHLNADSLISGLNQLFPEIKMKKIKLSHDTLYTLIMDSYTLTEAMGTSGAAEYLATAVINLTSVNAINYVKINFKMGSHASPGTWAKNEFENYKVIR